MGCFWLLSIKWPLVDHLPSRVDIELEMYGKDYKSSSALKRKSELVE
jgi:hypothetical protein